LAWARGGTIDRILASERTMNCAAPKVAVLAQTVAVLAQTVAVLAQKVAVLAQKVAVLAQSTGIRLSVQRLPRRLATATPTPRATDSIG
jgi:hypothetical protein